jgi:hypothetical protein
VTSHQHAISEPPVLANQNWREMSAGELIQASIELEEEGLCNQPNADPDRWFPRGEQQRPRPGRAEIISLRRAWTQCRDKDRYPCRVIATCLKVALARRERHGIWAGQPGWKLAQIAATTPPTPRRSQPTRRECRGAPPVPPRSIDGLSPASGSNRFIDKRSDLFLAGFASTALL